MPTVGGIWRALERGADVGCEVVQFFVKNNMQWFGKPYQDSAVAAYAKALASHGFHAVFGHTGYLINLGADPSPNREKSIESLVQEIELATRIGLPFLVLHPGAHLGKGEARGIENVAAGLNEVFRLTRTSPVRIALENTAGQGTCLGFTTVHLAEIYRRVDPVARLGLCLDTAHFFAAGYDIRTRKGWNLAIREVKGLIGLDQVLAFHLNDSKTELGSRVDRHAGIGQGRIGEEAFRHIVNDRRFARTPGCLETPKSKDLHEDRENLATLRSLVRRR